MNDYFDIVAVELDGGSKTQTCVFCAPSGVVKAGDQVNTELSEFGVFDGTVIAVTGAWKGDDAISFLLKYGGIKKILNVSRKVTFEEEYT